MDAQLKSNSDGDQNVQVGAEIEVRLSSDDDQQIRRQHRSDDGTALRQELQRVVRDELGGDVDIEIEFLHGSFVAKIVLLAKQAVRWSASTLERLAQRLRTCVINAFRGIKNAVAKVEWKHIERAASLAASVLTILSFFGFGGGKGS